MIKLPTYGSKNHFLMTCLLKTILLISLLATFAPINPIFPGVGLDPSWVMSTSYAAANNFNFGSDIIFTFGPYSSLYTKIFNPELDATNLFAGTYLALGAFFLFSIFLTKNFNIYTIIFIICVSFINFEFNSYMFLLPILTCIIHHDEFAGLSYIEKKYSIHSKIILSFIFSSLSILPLIKTSLLPVCIFCILFCTFITIYNKKYFTALLPATSFITSLLFFWAISGQKLRNIIDYFSTTIDIISGYTDAMSYPGRTIEPIAFVVISSCILIITFTTLRNKSNKFSILSIITILCAYLFVCFKQGFVRHDGHAMAASSGILITSFIAGSITTKKISFATIAGSTLFFLIIYTSYNNNNINGIIRINEYLKLHAGVADRLNGSMQESYEKSVLKIKKTFLLPTLEGTTDIFSFNQAFLIASMNSWSPRPIFQSYSAYTPKLAQLNAEHLRGDKAPSHIFFRVEPIDRRLPALEDGLSWPILLHRYTPVAADGPFLRLTKKETPLDDPELIKIKSFQATMGIPVVLTENSPIFSVIKINKTVIGNLVSFLYKPSILIIEIVTANNDVRQYRMISSMAESGFFISPLIENTNDFYNLYGKQDALSDNRVTSFRIFPMDQEWQWADAYNIELYKR